MLIKVSDPTLVPTRATPFDAGIDLRAEKDYIIKANSRVLVSTGISVKIPKGCVGLLVPRSSLSKRGLTLTNSVGIIDANYRGIIMASLSYSIPVYDGGIQLHEVKVEKGERIVQLLILPCLLPDIQISNESQEEWENTDRGTGGFGSTGN